MICTFLLDSMLAANIVCHIRETNFETYLYNVKSVIRKLRNTLLDIYRRPSPVVGRTVSAAMRLCGNIQNSNVRLIAFNDLFQTLN